MNECLNRWIKKLMGLLITECLRCDVSNFLTIREKKEEMNLPCSPVVGTARFQRKGCRFNLWLGTKIPHAGWHCQKKGRLNVIGISQIFPLKFKENDY